jgi:uncharacterized protein YdeI (YjbR/CyaY-like superfamily)
MQVESFYAKDRAEWHDWLLNNHNNQQSVWLIYDKGASRTLSYDDIVEEALCFGWIDSIPGKVSDTQTKIYVSKRKPKSVWSKTNKERIEKLLSLGMMHPSGKAAIDTAKANGSWDALNQSDKFEIPLELQSLLDTSPKAKEFYFSLPPSSHKIILEWIYAAKKEETKLARINETVSLANKGIKAHHYRQ